MLYGQIRATLKNNRVLYATSKKSILAARYVLEQTQETWAEQLRAQEDSGDDGDALPSEQVSSKMEQSIDRGGAEDNGTSPDARRDGVTYEAEQTETKTWVCECLNRILGILLDQIPLRVEARYQEIINFCLLESTYGK